MDFKLISLRILRYIPPPWFLAIIVLTRFDAFNESAEAHLAILQ